MRVHFGLGAASKIDWLQIRWPSGLTERFTDIAIDKIHTLKEGSGTAVTATEKKP
jgi:enediyne biosynthesis protein E4